MSGIIDKNLYRRTLLKALLDAWKRGNRVIATDSTHASLDYKNLFTRSLVLADFLKRPLADEPYVAVLLPNTLAVLATFVCLQILGKIPCMLNFSAGETNVAHACKITAVKTVITARAFIEQAKLEPLIAHLEKHWRIIYLEDVRDKISIVNKLSGVLQSRFPGLALIKRLAASPDAHAVVLYTSGSEGMPKGVALSHANILANIEQVKQRITFKPDDIVFNALPVFHSFGLTVGTLMPLLLGIKTYLYPSPLHYKIIPTQVHKSGATIMLGTDTFYQGYAAYGTKEQFAKIWLAVAGAEKLKDATLARVQENLGITIMQGYGVTEASPVISCNTPDKQKIGTVGCAFPDIDCRLEPVPGLAQGGRLSIRGPNVMLGYFKADKPGVIQPQGEWYDTGDIVDIADDGFITILGRAKRFAKIGGEMVSLLAVEEAVSAFDPEKGHAAIAVADERKGEKIVLYTENPALKRETLPAWFREKGLSDLCIPREVVHIEALPRLGSGKIDYVILAAKVGKV